MATILIAEDEEDIFQLMLTQLVRHGHFAIWARDGEEALAHCRSCPNSLHLVITGIYMPRMNGFDLGRELETHFPNLPVIYMSAKPVVGRLKPESIFLHKPFSEEELLSAINSALPNVFVPMAGKEDEQQFADRALSYNAIALAKAGDSMKAQRIATQIRDTQEQRSTYIEFLRHQIKIGDLGAAKEMALDSPALWTGGHWVEEMIRPLVKAGDVQGAMAIVHKLENAAQQKYHIRLVAIARAEAGDIKGARETLGLLAGDPNG